MTIDTIVINPWGTKVVPYSFGNAVFERPFMLKKNYIIISLFFLISFNSSKSYYINSTIDGLCHWAYDNPKYSLPLIAGTTVSLTVLAYKKIEFFRKKINQLGDVGQNFFNEKILFPLLLKYEIIKDEGLSKKDLIILASLVLGSYGVKKANDYFGIFNCKKLFCKK